jgi:hypothetical protein
VVESPRSGGRPGLTPLPAGDHLIELVGNRRAHVASPAGPFPVSAFCFQYISSCPVPPPISTSRETIPCGRPTPKTAAQGRRRDLLDLAPLIPPRMSCGPGGLPIANRAKVLKSHLLLLLDAAPACK